MPDAALLAAAVAGIPPETGHIAVAVSGGGDSLALLHLLAEVAPSRGLRVDAVTVDHRLRPASAAEAAFVAKVCAGLRVAHTVLVWNHDDLAGNLMANARDARHRLIAAWAQAQGIGVVALGHTADDQAEGLLMALARESGLDGLSGMAALRVADGLIWARPLLGQTRADLRAYLRRRGQDWIDDPTNADPRYLRVQARAALAGLAAMGITPRGMARSVGLLGQARRALEVGVVTFAQAHAIEIAGALDVDRAAFGSLHTETQRRFLLAAVRWIGGAAYPPRRGAQVQALAALNDGQGAVLGGVRIRVGPRALRLAREPRSVGAPVMVGRLWDGRWMVQGAAGVVRALGADGLAQIPDWRSCGVPRDALVVSPGIWDGARLIAAPLAGYGHGYTAELQAGFRSFLLSH